VPSGTGVDSVFVRVVRDAEPMFVAAVPDGGNNDESWLALVTLLWVPDLAV